MNPLIASAAIQAGSSLLGGLLGGGKKGPSMQDQLSAQAYMDRNRPSWVMQGAEKAGIHPLAALGMPAMSAPVAQVGGQASSGQRLGSAISSMGAGVSRAVQAYGTAESRAIEKKMLSLQLHGLELDNIRKASEIALMTQPGTPPAMSTSGVEGFHDMISKQMPDDKIGVKGGVNPMFKIATDDKGNPVRIWNEEDLGDNETMSILAALGYSIPDLIHGRITKPGARKIAPIIRALTSPKSPGGRLSKLKSPHRWK